MLGPVKLDPESGVPLYRQLADAVSRLIDQGSLVVGDRLASHQGTCRAIGPESHHNLSGLCMA